MLKKLVYNAKDFLSEVAGILFVLFSAPIIHLAGLDKTDEYPDSCIKNTKQNTTSLAQKLQKCDTVTLQTVSKIIDMLLEHIQTNNQNN